MNLLERNENKNNSAVSNIHCRTRLVSPPSTSHNVCQLNTGKVYTPTFLASWVASTLLNFVSQESVTAIDPACGEGELLLALRNCSKKKIHCIGVDIDDGAISKAKQRLGANSTFKVMDSLIPLNRKDSKGRITNKKVDVLIANPPWGADLNYTTGTLIKRGYNLAKGQFDSWDLFAELSLFLVKPSGLIALILPDAIFLPEHENIRELLNKSTTILMIARLGEGFFKNVYRGTTVLLLKNEPYKKSHKIEVFRLNKETRDSILQEKKSIEEVRKETSHFISQKRLEADKHFSWDIDSREEESKNIQSIFSSYHGWADWLISGRGVELSKSGRIVLCPKCENAVPTPRTPRQVACVNCGHKYHSTSAQHSLIISDRAKNKKEWTAFIAGEDVCRYQAQPSRMIKRFVEGINYKDDQIYKKERLLVRKTGVGINASIINQEAYTNQVVFHYLKKENTKIPDFYMSYVLGVLNSRVMFAYHLRKNGENEWRSHPYVTQKILARLPIPAPNSDNFSWKQAKAIADKVDILLKLNKVSEKTDIEIECLVAGMYKLTSPDIEWVRNVIESAQELAPMKQMKKADLKKVTAIYV